ncbi:MAG: ImpA family metalloprotease, partial [Myxococcota bacterium]|nr:ImpA family metalloprotease [Myxococcota bacterium]
MNFRWLSLLTLGGCLALAGCTPWYGIPCPVQSSEGPEGQCACDPGTYGSLEWDDDSGAYLGSCRTGLEEALRTGNPASLEEEAEILSEARGELARILDRHNSLLRGIYADDPIDYIPGAWSHHILSTRPEDTFVLVQGSQAGYSLAALGQQGESNYAGFGFNLLRDFYDGGHAGYRPAFDRLLTWMLTDSPTGTVPTDLSVAVASIGWDQGAVYDWLVSEHPSWEIEQCSDTDDLAACLSGNDLVVLGSSGDNSQAEALGEATRQAVEAGTAVLFVHTEGWTSTARGSAILSELGMSLGDYGGNYWSEDSADWDLVEDMLEQGGVIGALDIMLAHFEAGDFNFDWSYCTTSVGRTTCGDVPGFRTEFLNGAEALKGLLAQLDREGVDLFSLQERRLSKLCVLLADFYRDRIVYPLSKSDEDILPFLRAYYADHVVHYRRQFNPSQGDLGSFSGLVLAEETGLQDSSVSIEVSRYGGFTAVGYYALPGVPFTVRLLSGAELNPQVHINTQR